MFVLVPIENIKKANELFVKYDQFREETGQYQNLSRIYENQINDLTRQVIAYDNLVRVKDSEIDMTKRISEVNHAIITRQQKQIKRLKFGVAGAVIVAITTAILK